MILLTIIASIAVTASFILDLLLFHWHFQDRKRLAVDEARLDEDERLLRKNSMANGNAIVDLAHRSGASIKETTDAFIAVYRASP